MSAPSQGSYPGANDQILEALKDYITSGMTTNAGEEESTAGLQEANNAGGQDESALATDSASEKSKIDLPPRTENHQ